MSYLWLCLVGIVIQTVFIIVEYKKRYLPAVILKGCASIAFIVLGTLSAQTAMDQSFASLIVAGLVMGGIGDICLNLRFVLEKAGKKIFLLGVAAFLIGHILYLAALIPLAGASVIFSLPAGAVAAALLLAWLLKQMEVKGAFKIFGIVYIGVVVLMTAVAASLFIMQPESTRFLMFMIGAILFTASDVVLVFNLFGKTKHKALRATNLSLYYLGQLLIALSLQLS